MEFGSAIMCIINLLFVPLIALHYYCSRNKLKFEHSPDCVYMYVLICVLNVLASDFFVSLLEKFFAATYQVTTGGQLGMEFPTITLFTQLAQKSFSCPVHSVVYTAVALVSSFLLVLFIEIMQKTRIFEVSIEKRQARKRKVSADGGEKTENES